MSVVKVEKVVVRFIKSTPPYTVGEIAGFDLKTADLLVKRKQAVMEPITQEKKIKGFKDKMFKNEYAVSK